MVAFTDTPPVLPESQSESFALSVPAAVFAKADAPSGQGMRIAGIISTEGLDQQQETLLQNGLNFDKFLKTGFLNNTHSSRSLFDILGYPQSVKAYAKGETLPNGQTAEENSTWFEGFLVGSKGEEVYRLAKDLQRGGRSLGLSVEGSIQQRDSKDRNIVRSAQVSGVALCASPVNTQCQMEVLLRSLLPHPSAVQKTMTHGTPPPQSEANPLPQPKPNEAATGAGVGRMLTAQFPARLQSQRKRLKKKRVRKVQKSLSRKQALTLLLEGVPGLQPHQAAAILKSAEALEGFDKL